MERGEGSPRTAGAMAPRMTVLPVRQRGDVVAAGVLARQLAEAGGADKRQASKIAIVACELAANALKHAGGGELHIATDEERIVLTAHDAGPPFASFAAALADGSDDRGPIGPADLSRHCGLGCGLGAVGRLADSIDHDTTKTGKWVSADFARVPRR